MSDSPRGRSLVVWLASVVVGLILVGSGIMLLSERDDVPPGTDTAQGDATPGVGPTAPASATAPASPAPSPSATPAPSSAPKAAPRVGARLRDLAALVPKRVAGFRQLRNRPAAPLRRQTGAQEARRVRYGNRRGVEVTHLVALYGGQRPAGAVLRERRAQLLQRRGARVVDDTNLEDSRGVRRGRLLEVRRRGGDVVVLWRNRNLVGVLGPGRHRLQRRLYDAWPY